MVVVQYDLVQFSTPNLRYLAIISSLFLLWRKGSGERPLAILFYYLQFLGIVNWLLIASDQRKRTVNRC